MRSTRLQLLVTLAAVAVAVAILVVNGLPPSYSLSDALIEFNTPAVRNHLRRGACLEFRDRWMSAVNVAVIARDEARLREFIARGDKVDCQGSPYGFTPLHCAVFIDWFDAVVLLVNSGADVSACDPSGQTPLWFAKRFDKKAIADFLRQHGARE